MGRIELTLAISRGDDPAFESRIHSESTNLVVRRVVEVENVLNEIELPETDCLIFMPDSDSDEKTLKRNYSSVRSMYSDLPIVVVTENDEQQFIEQVLADEYSEYFYAAADQSMGLFSTRVRRLVTGS